MYGICIWLIKYKTIRNLFRCVFLDFFCYSVSVEISLPFKLWTDHFFISVQTYNISRGSNNFPHYMYVFFFAGIYSPLKSILVLSLYSVPQTQEEELGRWRFLWQWWWPVPWPYRSSGEEADWTHEESWKDAGILIRMNHWYETSIMFPWWFSMLLSCHLCVLYLM